MATTEQRTAAAYKAVQEFVSSPIGLQLFQTAIETTVKGFCMGLGLGIAFSCICLFWIFFYFLMLTAEVIMLALYLFIANVMSLSYNTVFESNLGMIILSLFFALLLVLVAKLEWSETKRNVVVE